MSFLALVPTAVYVVGGAAIAAAVAVPSAIAAVGFTTAGVVGGSIAAGIQSGMGNIAGGSLFAMLQSAGTVPWMTGAIGAGVTAVVGTVAAVAAAIF